MPMTLDQLAGRLEAMAAGGLRKAILPVLVGGAQEVQRAAKMNVRSGSGLHVRSGRLWQSITANVEMDEGALAIVARAGGTGGRGMVRYARMQEQGGIQKPSTPGIKYLRIPIPGGPALTNAGLDRYPPPLRQTAPPGFFRVHKSEAGNLLLVHDKITRGGKPKMELWYVLRRSVTIPARPYLRPALEATAKTLPGEIGKAIVTAITKGA
jgi:hypothetical protein